jgi:hypothetical protein
VRRCVADFLAPARLEVRLALLSDALRPARLPQALRQAFAPLAEAAEGPQERARRQA